MPFYWTILGTKRRALLSITRALEAKRRLTLLWSFPRGPSCKLFAVILADNLKTLGRRELYSSTLFYLLHDNFRPFSRVSALSYIYRESRSRQRYYSTTTRRRFLTLNCLFEQQENLKIFQQVKQKKNTDFFSQFPFVFLINFHLCIKIASF